MHKIKIEQFEGPLDLLLELIEAEKLDITEVSLAKIADEFVASLRQVEATRPEELADFLVVAAKLLLIKSRVLLPYLVLDEDDDATDLARQLKMYKVYFDASKRIRKMLHQHHVVYTRAQLPPTPVFSPPEGLTTDELVVAFRTVLARLEPVIRLPREVYVKTVNLQATIRSIRERLLEQTNFSFSHLMADARSKVEIIVTFLALLELVKQRAIAVVQDERFSDISIARVEAVALVD